MVGKNEKRALLKVEAKNHFVDINEMVEKPNHFVEANKTIEKTEISDFSCKNSKRFSTLKIQRTVIERNNF